jgi:Flp pilus assembly protein TadD
LEWWPRTVFDQQLLMKYDEDIPAIKDMADRSHDPIIKAMWLRRLGVVYFTHGDLSEAQEYFSQALLINPSDVDSLNALAVVYHQRGQEEQSVALLKRSLAFNPSYPDTLRTLGIHYYINNDYSQARIFLSRCFILDPDNQQVRQLLRLANKVN